MSSHPQHPRIHLASRSTRRRELLTQIGVQFDAIIFRNPPRDDQELDETPQVSEDPVGYVTRVALAKAEYGRRIVNWRKLLPQAVLAADTTVELAGEIIGKPNDYDDAMRILRQLSGHTHRVLTTVAIDFEGRLETSLSISKYVFVHSTKLRFAVMSLVENPWTKLALMAFKGTPECLSSIYPAATQA